MSRSSPHAKWKRCDLGPHRVEQIDEDIFCIRWGQSLTYDNMKQVIDWVESQHVSRGPLFFLLDMHTSGVPDQRARRLSVERVKALQLHAAAILGANFTIRTIITLMSNVLRLTHRPPKTRFFDQEEDALVWLAAQRDEAAKSR